MHWAERKAMERRGRIACVEKKRRGERRMTKKLKGGGGGGGGLQQAQSTRYNLIYS